MLFMRDVEWSHLERSVAGSCQDVLAVTWFASEQSVHGGRVLGEGWGIGADSSITAGGSRWNNRPLVSTGNWSSNLT